jgi:hypothetical protein
MEPDWDGPRGTVHPGVAKLGWLRRAEQVLGGMIKEFKITGTSGHASSFADDGSDATRVTPGDHHTG